MIFIFSNFEIALDCDQNDESMWVKIACDCIYIIYYIILLY